MVVGQGSRLSRTKLSDGAHINMLKNKDMNSETHMGPGIQLPPPIIYLITLLIGVVLNSLWDMSFLPGLWRYIVGSLLIVVNLMIMPPVFRRFRRADTPFFNFHKDTSTLITEGYQQHLSNF